MFTDTDIRWSNHEFNAVGGKQSETKRAHCHRAQSTCTEADRHWPAGSQGELDSRDAPRHSSQFKVLIRTASSLTPSVSDCIHYVSSAAASVLIASICTVAVFICCGDAEGLSTSRRHDVGGFSSSRTDRVAGFQPRR